jgi:P27 family predicted phage terminase small subunit
VPPGPKPKPNEVKRAEGNPGRRPLPEPIRFKSDAELVPPDDFDEDSLEAWNMVVPTLREVGVLDGIDQLALAMACRQYARSKQAGRVIDKQGMVAKGSTGQVTEHPMAQAERNAMQLFLRFAEQYALTPVARVRLGLAELQRKSLQEEITESIGPPTLHVVDAEVEDA